MEIEGEGGFRGGGGGLVQVLRSSQSNRALRDQGRPQFPRPTPGAGVQLVGERVWRGWGRCAVGRRDWESWGGTHPGGGPTSHRGGPMEASIPVRPQKASQAPGRGGREGEGSDEVSAILRGVPPE